MIYEHRFLAEKYIGRPLKSTEEVHHKDRDRSNNSKNNLVVFKTKEDHSRYHATGIMTKLEDGSYASPSTENSRICECCDSEFLSPRKIQTYCSKSCAMMYKRRVVERPSKEDLLKLVKNNSFNEVGRMYGVSDNAVRKWCTSYGLPYLRKELDTFVL